MRSPTLWPFVVALAGLPIGAGTGLAGIRIADAIARHPREDRHVTVKGLSEREVPADRAAFALTSTITANELESLQRDIDRNIEAMRRFVRDHEIDDADVEVAQTIVTDNYANPYAMQHGAPRYHARAGIRIRSDEVDKVAAAARDLDQLLRQGLLLDSTRPTYAFTGLNDIKPDMLADATRNARLAAQEFARASLAAVGQIRHAQQGVFSIQGASGEIDPETGSSDGMYSIAKRVRVVTTVEFALE